MRNFQVGQSRLSYYDRNLVLRVLVFQIDNLVPHGLTTRDTYTVPVGKKFIIAAVQVSLRRNTAAAPVGMAQAYATIGGVRVCQAWINNNNVDARHDAILSSQNVVSEGLVVNLVTSDSSTGGTIDYRMSLHGEEFDA